MRVSLPLNVFSQIWMSDSREPHVVPGFRTGPLQSELDVSLIFYRDRARWHFRVIKGTNILINTRRSYIWCPFYVFGLLHPLCILYLWVIEYISKFMICNFKSPPLDWAVTNFTIHKRSNIILFQGIVENKKFVEKLRSIHTLTSRKHKLEENQRVTRARMNATFNTTFVVRSPVKKQRIKPEWSLNKDKMTEIENPLKAIDFVMCNLSIQKKVWFYLADVGIF